MHSKRLFLLGFIFSFAAAAFIAIVVLLFGKWGLIEAKILLTTLSIGVYSLVALCCSAVSALPNRKLLADVGVILCGIGLLFALLTNWEIITPGHSVLFKARFLFLSLAMAVAAICLILRTEPFSSLIKIFQYATIFFIILTTILINYVIWGTVRQNHDYLLIIYKLIAVSSILGLLGIIVTPILRKVSK